MSVLSRRQLLKFSLATAGAFSAGGVLSACTSGTVPTPPNFTLTPQLSQFNILDTAVTQGMMSYGDSSPPTVLVARQGEPFFTRLDNRLPEPTTVHWHGVRLPNAMDGVPFLTQPYVYGGETFDYRFTPPDAGTFWYHPHCNTLTQMSKGLNGVLVVKEKNDPGFDADIPLNLRDWRLDDRGQFIDLYNLRKTARAGTFGTIKTANWRESPNYFVPTGGLVRVRVVISDITRIFRLSAQGAPVKIVAIDSHPLTTLSDLAFDNFGPGQRVDLVIAMPSVEGQHVRLINSSSSKPWVVASFTASGPNLGREVRDIHPLPDNPVKKPDLGSAETIELDFTATADQVPKSGFCGTLGFSFWAINKRSWRGVSPNPADPLMELKLGKSYLLDIRNRTPHSHPVHLHGLAFQILQSNKRRLPPLWTDTALVLPDETIRVGLVADNLGDWLLHCHIIEHQKTGMSAYARVT